MSLEIEAPVGIGESAAQEMHSTWDTLEAVRIELMKEGFYTLEVPRFAMPILNPSTFTNFHPEQFTLLYLQMESWQSYTSDILAVVDGGILQCENEMDDIEVHIKEGVRKQCEAEKTKKPADTTIGNMVKTDPRYRELRLYHQTLKQRKALLESQFKRLGRGMRLLSRYVEVEKLKAGTNSARSGM